MAANDSKQGKRRWVKWRDPIRWWRRRSSSNRSWEAGGIANPLSIKWICWSKRGWGWEGVSPKLSFNPTQSESQSCSESSWKLFGNIQFHHLPSHFLSEFPFSNRCRGAKELIDNTINRRDNVSLRGYEEERSELFTRYSDTKVY